jgi:predicted component of type VI protein secretion system
LRIDRLFLEKFTESSIYLKSEEDFVRSIIHEIGNILSCRLDSTVPISDSPFSYGTQDLESVNTSAKELSSFGALCRSSILRFEPRLEDLEISDIKIDRETQTLFLDIVCYPKLKEFPKFSTLLTRRTY